MKYAEYIPATEDRLQTATLLRDNGWEPVPVGVGTKGCFKPGWPTAPLDEVFDAWFAGRERYHLGIRNGIGVDNDCTDPELAAKVDTLRIRILGDTPLERIGNAPKTLHLYAGDFGYLSSMKIARDGLEARVEVLGNGKQFVAFARHSKTEKAYHWPQATPADMKYTTAPTITLEKAQEFVKEVNALLEQYVTDHGWERTLKANTSGSYEVGEPLALDAEYIEKATGASFTPADVLEMPPQAVIRLVCTWPGGNRPDDARWYLDEQGLPWLMNWVTSTRHYIAGNEPPNVMDAVGELGRALANVIPPAPRTVEPLTHTFAFTRLKITGEGNRSAKQPTVLENVADCLNHWGIVPRINMLTHEVQFDHPELDALATHDLRVEMLYSRAALAGLEAPQRFRALVENVAETHRYHPVARWLPEWDGVSRFEALVASVSPSEGFEEVWRAYLLRWSLQGVDAWCNVYTANQYEGTLLFGGPEGCGKTTWFESLLPEPWVQSGIALHLGRGPSGEKDSLEQATMQPIGELGELETTFSSSEQGGIKNFLSRAHDTYRTAYGRKPVRYPRMTIFGASVNDAEILRQGDNRRYWGVRVARCDAYHGVDMAQYWAEMRHRLDAGETFVLNETERLMHKKTIVGFRDVTDAEDLVEAAFGDNTGPCKPMNYRQVVAELRACAGFEGVAQAMSSLAFKRSLRAALGARKYKKIIDAEILGFGRVQNAWMIPTKAKKRRTSGSKKGTTTFLGDLDDKRPDDDD